jgi:hypothetical protein
VRVIHGWGNGINAGSRRLNFTSAGGNRLRFRVVNDAGTLYSADWNSTLPPNTWHRVSGVLDTAGGNIYLYVDGVERAVTSIAGAFTTTLADHKIGRRADVASEFLRARIDDVRIWSTARTAAEVEENMWQELAGTESGLAHNWQFNEGTGTSAADKVSGGTDGTVTGATWLSSEDGSVEIAASPFSWDDLLLANTSAVAHNWRESISKLDAISEIAASGGFFHCFESSGALRVGRVDVPKAAKLGASAIHLDGRGAALKATYASSIAVDDEAFTFEIWIRPDDPWGTECIVAKHHFATGIPTYTLGDGWRIDLVDGVPTAYGTIVNGSVATVLSGGAPLRSGAWAHLALSVEKGTADKFRLFVNGELVDSATLSAGHDWDGAGTEDLWIGSRYGVLPTHDHNDEEIATHPRSFRGVVDEIRLWSNPRKAINIARDMLQEVAVGAAEDSDNGSTAVLQAYWTCNDGSGNQATDAVGSAHLAFVGSPQWCRAVDATIKDTDLLTLPVPVEPMIPQALIRVGWNPCFRTMDSGELADSVSSERRAFLAEPFRWATEDSPAVRTAHPLTRELDGVPAHFSTEAAAKTEAVRLAPIFGQQRAPLRAAVSRQFGHLNPGDLVRLVYPRRGMDQGADFVALGVRDDPAAHTVLSTELALWG